MTWLPWGRVDVEKVAWPEPSTGTLAANVVVPSVKVTVPVVTGLPPLVTVAVKVTDWPVRDGFSDDVTPVLVATAPAVVMLSVHPPEMLPASGQASSRTYRLHVPFGSIPLNAARVVLPDGDGAGGGKASGPLNSA